MVLSKRLGGLVAWPCNWASTLAAPMARVVWYAQRAGAMASRMNKSIWEYIFSQKRGGANTRCGATSRMSLNTVPEFSGKWTTSPKAKGL